ncbi:MAG TPA: HEAT repeat domain-containing protein, partial [Polyangiaceae bacterium]
MLGPSSLPRTIEAALRDIEHARAHVRRSAVVDLVRLTAGPERARAIRALTRVLLADASAEVRTDAAIALADAGASEARVELLAALDDAHISVAERAVLALGEVCEPGDSDVLDALRALMGHEQAALRFQALIAFDALGGDDAVAALERASADDDPEVRAMAFRLAWRRFEHAEPPSSLRARAESVLAEPNAPARVTAALFLGARRHAAAERALVDVIDGTLRASEADVFAAIETAAEHGLEAARLGLARRAFGLFGVRVDTLGWQSCIALARFGDERATSAIVRRLASWNRDSRTLA